MPMISSVTNAALAQKPENKSMGICLTASNTGVEFTTTSIGGLNNNNNNTNMRNSNNNAENPSTSAANFFAPANVAGQVTRGPVATAVMLAKLPHNNARQTVILQQRPTTSIGPGKGPIPIRVPAAVIAPNNVVPASSSTISVRTRLVSPNQHSMPVLNLSQSGSSGTFAPMVTNVKQIMTATGQKLVGNESLNFVISNSNNTSPTTSAINLKTNPNSSDDLKTSMPVAVQSFHINKVNKLMPTAAVSGAIVTNQPRMLSINNAGQGQSTRVEIINANVANKSALVNNYKTFIISSPNPPSSETLLVGSNLNFTTNKISVAPNSQLMAAAASRGNVATTNTFNNTVTVHHHQQQQVIAGKPTILTMATPAGAVPGATNLFNNQNSLPMASAHLTYQPGIVVNTNNTSSGAFSTFTPAVPSSVVVSSLSSSLYPNQPKVSISTIKQATISGTISGPKSNSPKPRVVNRKRSPNHYSTSTPAIANGSMSNQSSAYNLSHAISNANLIGHASSSTFFASSDIVVDPPRKKQRKQLLEPGKRSDHDLEPRSTSPKENGVATSASNSTNDGSDQASTIMRARPRMHVPVPSPGVRRTCQHFVRYSDVKFDVKPKSSSTKRAELLADVKRQTGGYNFKIANQLGKSSEYEASELKSILEQFLLVIETEISPKSKAAAISTLYGNPESAEKMDKIDQMCMKINDLARANIQRTKLIIENFNASKQSLINLTEDHKEKMATITKKISHKRNFIK